MPFNINAKNFLITYPQCTLSKEEVLEGLQSKQEISTWTVCEEKHSDGSPHVHALICLSTRLHTSNERYFDLGLFHPNIKTLKTKSDVARAHTYLLKDGQYITNFQEVLGKRAQLAKTIIDAGRLSKRLILENPEIIFLNHSSVANWLRYLQPPQERIQVMTKKRHIWLDGPSNSGKTTWLYAYLSLCEDPAEIPTNNDFSHVGESTDCLYIDEYKGALTVQQINKICDGNTLLNTKGGSTRIRVPTVVVVSNYSVRECYAKVEDKILETLLNRFRLYDASFNLPPFPTCPIK